MTEKARVLSCRWCGRKTRPFLEKDFNKFASEREFCREECRKVHKIKKEMEEEMKNGT